MGQADAQPPVSSNNPTNAPKIDWGKRRRVGDAYLGLAWLRLTERQYVDAEDKARKALDNGATPTEAYLVLGLAIFRQPNRVAEASDAFKATLSFPQDQFRTQARSWLAMTLAAQFRVHEAVCTAKEAVAEAPNSPLARANYAQILLLAEDPWGASREARKAVQLARTAKRTDAAAIYLANGWAALAVGDTDRAFTSARLAATLEPDLLPALYLLAATQEAQGDYSRAQHTYEECVRLAPDFLPAVAGGALVKHKRESWLPLSKRRHQGGEALPELLRFEEANSREIQSALGKIYYSLGNYTKAEYHLMKALSPSGEPPASADYALLARVLIDDNQLGRAIITARQAVLLSPSVGRFHAILGLAYEFSGMGVQATQEYRRALSLDSQNALARARLGLATQDIGERVAAVTQSFASEPSLPDDLLRGGTDLEASLFHNWGRTALWDGSGVGKLADAESRFHLFGQYDHAEDLVSASTASSRDKSDEAAFNLGVRINPYWNFFASYVGTRDRLAPTITSEETDGASSQPVTLPQEKKNDGVEYVAQFREGRNYLWIGVNTTRRRYSETLFAVETLPDGTHVSHTALSATQEDFAAPEIRWDIALNGFARYPKTLTLGIGYAGPLEIRTDVTSLNRSDFHGNALTAYGQFAGEVTRNLHVTAHFRFDRRRQRTEYTYRPAVPVDGGGDSPSPFRTDTVDKEDQWVLLPSFLIAYQPQPKTALRLSWNRQAQEFQLAPTALNGGARAGLFGATPFALRPVDIQLAQEPTILPSNGTPRLSHAVALEWEQYLNARTLVKLIGFHSLSENQRFASGTASASPDVFSQGIAGTYDIRRTGGGMRYEQQYGERLFGAAYIFANRTTADYYRTESEKVSQTPPLQSGVEGGAVINYIDRWGYKALLSVRHVGSRYATVDNIQSPLQTRLPAMTVWNMQIGRDLQRYELRFAIVNLFATRDGDTHSDSGRQFSIGTIVRL